MLVEREEPEEMTPNRATAQRGSLDGELEMVAALAAAADTHRLLTVVIRAMFSRRIALVSSFGAESAVLLHLVATVDPSTPVIFLDTGKLFPETLHYRDELVTLLGLRDVRTCAPSPGALAAADSSGDLGDRDPDACCRLRKSEPLLEALDGFAAWINGRKRYQSDARAGIPLVERVDGRIKINALADWTGERVRIYFAKHRLPRHPLEVRGYPSIGCAPCTTTVSTNEASRAGRWRGLDKSECGIHGGATCVRAAACGSAK